MRSVGSTPATGPRNEEGGIRAIIRPNEPGVSCVVIHEVQNMQPGFSACGVFLNRISQANKNRFQRKGLFGGSFRMWEAGQRRLSNRVERGGEGGHGFHDSELPPCHFKAPAKAVFMCGQSLRFCHASSRPRGVGTLLPPVSASAVCPAASGSTGMAVTALVISSSPGIVNRDLGEGGIFAVVKPFYFGLGSRQLTTV